MFSSNLELQEVSIDAIGTHAFKYDRDVSSKLDKRLEELIRKVPNKKKGVVLSGSDLDYLLELTKKHPKQGQLFAKNTLVSIVSTLDNLFGKIFEQYYTENPEKLSLENKTISYSDLINLTDIASAQKFLIRREVEGVLFKGFKERINLLKSQLEIDIPGGEKSLTALKKLIKIRNLIVHNEGRADKDFLDNFSEEEIKEGVQIKITQEYLKDSLVLVYFVGSFILQDVQIKLAKEKIHSGEYILNEVIHLLVKKGQHEFLKSIYEYAVAGKLDDVNRKMVVINYCIAAKKSGKNVDHINKILDKEDWSSTENSPEFACVLFALRGNDQEFYAQLHKALKSKTLGKEELKQWEIFSFYRKKAEFKKIENKVKTNSF